MRFRFLGGLDCPDWVVYAISQVSNLYSSTEFSKLVNNAIRIINNGEMEQDQDDLVLGAIVLILRSTNQFGALNTLTNELQLLGLSYVQYSYCSVTVPMCINHAYNRINRKATRF